MNDNKQRISKRKKGQSGKQKSIWLSDEMWAWLDNLPEEYGSNLTEKVKFVMYRGKKRIEQEEEVIARYLDNKEDEDRNIES